MKFKYFFHKNGIKKKLQRYDRKLLAYNDHLLVLKYILRKGRRAMHSHPHEHVLRTQWKIRMTLMKKSVLVLGQTYRTCICMEAFASKKRPLESLPCKKGFF